MAGQLTAAGAPAARAAAPEEHATDRVETALLVEGVYRRFGVDLRGFDQPRLAARLAAFIARKGIDSISSLQGRVLRDDELARETLRFVAESTGAMAADGHAFTALRCAALPVLRSASWPVIWVAECGDAELVLQLAAMLDEEALLRRALLFVTHANEDLLAATAALRIGARQLDGLEARHAKAGGKRALRDYLEGDGDAYRVRPAFRSGIVFCQYDLSSDASFRECHAIVCARPLHDFDGALQSRALEIFSSSLCNFGILQVEAPAGILHSALRRDFACVLAEQGVYRRLPAGI
ncbi:MAG: hypothetical protein V4857_17950 [Pseudomonadota bacterium]